MKKYSVVAGVIILILTLSISLVNMSTSSSINTDITQWSGLDSDEFKPNTTIEENNSEVKVKHLSDEELRAKVEKLWGLDVANKYHRVDKSLDFSIPSNVRYLIPINITGVNWCGYMLVNPGIYGVAGFFEANQCTGADAYDGAWLGMGGIVEDNLLQTGVDMYLMEAWVEALPGYPQPVFDVNNGDEIHASVGYDEDNPGYYFVAIYDADTYDLWGDDIYYNPSSTACWIVETPYKGTIPQTQYHIGDFSTIHFSNCQWWDSTETYHTMNYGTGTFYRITETTLNNETMAPSNPGADWKSFTVNDP